MAGGSPFLMTIRMSSMPASIISQTTCAIAGTFPSGNNSFGMILLAGHMREALPAAAMTAICGR